MFQFILKNLRILFRYISFIVQISYKADQEEIYNSLRWGLDINTIIFLEYWILIAIFININFKDIKLT